MLGAVRDHARARGQGGRPLRALVVAASLAVVVPLLAALFSSARAGAGATALRNADAQAAGRELRLADVRLAPRAQGPALAPPAARLALRPPARAAIVVDARDGSPLFAFHADRRLPIASATKLMTALIARERLPLDRTLPAVSYRAAPAESVLGLAPGERMKVRDLLAATLLQSANDAAATLAVAVAGSQRRFVALMNRRARALGLRHTRFANPIGLDAPGAGSTARELAQLARAVLRDRFLARVVAMPQAVLASGAGRRIVRNRNDLVRRYPWVEGVKTGHTAGAGYVLVSAARGALGQRVVAVVLGAPNERLRDEHSLALLRFALARFQRLAVLDPRRPRAVAAEASARALVAPARALSLVLRRDQRARVVLRVERPLRGPLPRAARVGRFAVLVDGRPVAAVPAVLSRPLASTGTFASLSRRLGSGLTLLVLAAMLTLAVAALRATRPRRAPRPGVDTGR